MARPVWGSSTSRGVVAGVHRDHRGDRRDRRRRVARRLRGAHPAGARGLSKTSRHGASIAVNGVCLTVIGWTHYEPLSEIGFDVMAETMKRSAIGALRPGRSGQSRARGRADARLDGHIVQGHVDGTGAVLPAGRHRATRGRRSASACRGAGPVRRGKGVDRRRRRLPHRVRGRSRLVRGRAHPRDAAGDHPRCEAPGDPVNLEVDVLAKYVERLMESRTMTIRLDTIERASPTSRRASPSW